MVMGFRLMHYDVFLALFYKNFSSFSFVSIWNVLFLKNGNLAINRFYPNVKMWDAKQKTMKKITQQNDNNSNKKINRMVMAPTGT